MRFAERRRERRAGRPHVLLLVAQPSALGAARLPRLLHDAGCRVTLFAERQAVASRAGCLDEHVVAPSAGEDYFAALGVHLSREGVRYDWVLPATDTDVRGLFRRRAERWAAGCFPGNPDARDAEALVSKSAFGAAMERIGVPVPPARTTTTLHEALAAAAEIGYPVILKPLAGSAGAGTARVAGAAALRAAYAAAAEHGSVLVQRYVEGRVGSVQVVFNRGVPRAWVSSYKLLTWPGPFSPSSCRLFRTQPAIEPSLHRIGAAFGLHGLMGLDFMEERGTGTVSFLELNPRPGAIAHTGRAAGADFAGPIHDLASGGAGAGSVRQTEEDVVLPLFPQDLLRGLREADWLTLARWLCVPEEWRDVPWREPRLLARHMLILAQHARWELGRVVLGPPPSAPSAPRPVSPPLPSSGRMRPAGRSLRGSPGR
jgi:hypothetical protein